MWRLDNHLCGEQTTVLSGGDSNLLLRPLRMRSLLRNSYGNSIRQIGTALQTNICDKERPSTSDYWWTIDMGLDCQSTIHRLPGNTFWMHQSIN